MNRQMDDWNFSLFYRTSTPLPKNWIHFHGHGQGQGKGNLEGHGQLQCRSKF